MRGSKGNQRIATQSIDGEESGEGERREKEQLLQTTVKMTKKAQLSKPRCLREGKMEVSRTFWAPFTTLSNMPLCAKPVLSSKNWPFIAIIQEL